MNTKINLIVVAVLFTSYIFGQQGGSIEIFNAIRQNNAEAVKQILQKDPVKINARNATGATPLAFAAALRNRDLARLLIDSGALVNCGDNNLRAPIHLANFNSDTLMINLLLENGAVVDHRAVGGASPLIHSSLNNNYILSKYLIEKGADVNLQCNSLTIPLYFAVLNNNTKYLDFLLKKGSEIDVPDFLGRSPLYIAVRDGNEKIAEKLISYGASLNKKYGSDNLSLLHLAAIEGHSNLVKLLIEKGLNVNEKDENGLTPLDYALKYKNNNTAKYIKTKKGITGKKTAMAKQVKGNNKFEVIKLQNGAWGVATDKSFIVLGYSEIGNEPENKSISNGHITPDLIKSGKDIYIIDNDFHPVKGRFSLTGSNPLLSFEVSADKLFYVNNSQHERMFAKSFAEKTNFVKPGDKKTIGKLNISVLQSYEENKCYVIEVDGITIVWLTGISNNYLTYRRDTQIIRSLTEMKIVPDVLLLGSPAGIGPELAHGIRETYIESVPLKARNIFTFGHELLEKKVKYQLERLSINIDNLHVADYPGDAFEFENNE